MTYRVGPKGQVVLPKAIRDELGIVPGDEVEVTLDADAARIQKVFQEETWGGRFRGSRLTRDLEAEHRSELQK